MHQGQCVPYVTLCVVIGLVAQPYCAECAQTGMITYWHSRILAGTFSVDAAASHCHTRSTQEHVKYSARWPASHMRCTHLLAPWWRNQPDPACGMHRTQSCFLRSAASLQACVLSYEMRQAPAEALCFLVAWLVMCAHSAQLDIL